MRPGSHYSVIGRASNLRTPARQQVLGFQSLIPFHRSAGTPPGLLHALNTARHTDVRYAARQNHVPGRVSTHRVRTVSLAQQITLAFGLLYRLPLR